jgi:serine/threonine protein kinase
MGDYNFTTEAVATRGFKRLVNTYEDPRFGLCSIVGSSASCCRYIMKTKLMKDADLAADCESQVAKRKAMRHPNIQPLFDYFAYTQDGGSVTKYYVTTLYELPDTDLGEVVTVYRKKNLNLPMEIINQLALGILDGLVYLHSKKLYVQDLRPCYVGRDNTHGQRWFICDRLSKPTNCKDSTNDHIVMGDA